MIAGAVCISHTPLLDRSRAAPGIEEKFGLAVASAARFVDELRPNLTVLFFPDHFNGFFYNLMPSFCVGLQATSIGDFGTVPGQMDVSEMIAADCANFCVASGIDTASSYSMRVDHGAVQPLELLGGRGAPIVPIFINCVAPPLPTFARVRALGRSVGDWAARRPERVLVVSSGGLSHDPPIPQMANASAEVRERLIGGLSMTHTQRLERQRRVISLGSAAEAENAKLRPLNPDWDRSLLDACASGRLDSLDNSNDREITEIAGRGAHEVRTWIAGLSAVSAEGSYDAKVLFYSPVGEWITGTAIMTARQTEAKKTVGTAVAGAIHVE
jgi:2,3-dihydroxyphenylpropionate 1,2-dioxygenase